MSLAAATGIVAGMVADPVLADLKHQLCIGQNENRCPAEHEAFLGCGTDPVEAACLLCKAIVGKYQSQPYRIIRSAARDGDQCGPAVRDHLPGQLVERPVQSSSAALSEAWPTAAIEGGTWPAWTGERETGIRGARQSGQGERRQTCLLLEQDYIHRNEGRKGAAHHPKVDLRETTRCHSCHTCHIVTDFRKLSGNSNLPQMRIVTCDRCTGVLRCDVRGFD
jgi:hypothetical protein